MHLKRLIVALIALPLLYFLTVRLGPGAFLVILTIVTAGAQAEFYGMYKTSPALSAIGIIGGVLMITSSFLIESRFVPEAVSANFHPSVIMMTFLIMSTARLFLVRDPSASLHDMAPAITGFVYIPTLLLPQWYLRLNGYEWILLLYGSVWASDSLAYYVGKGMGKRKLYVEVSPNKTVEGAFGSILGGALSAFILGRLLFSDMNGMLFAFIGLMIGAVTIAGDLVESMFKRDAGVKDSGVLIPGHGGILDKIDGVLFAGPVLYLITLALT